MLRYVLELREFRFSGNVGQAGISKAGVLRGGKKTGSKRLDLCRIVGIDSLAVLCEVLFTTVYYLSL